MAAAAALVWSGDLPRLLLQVLFATCPAASAAAADGKNTHRARSNELVTTRPTGSSAYSGGQYHESHHRLYPPEILG